MNTVEALLRVSTSTHPVDRGRSLFHCLETAARAVPRAPVLVFGDDSRTYAQLYRAAVLRGWELRQEGMARGDVVAVVARDQLAHIEAWFGVLAAGGAFTILNPRWDAEYLAASIERLRPVALLAGEGHWQVAGTAVRLSGRPVPLVPLESSSERLRQRRSPSLERARAALEDRLRDLRPEDPALIVHTSATAGPPKAAVHSHGGLIAAAIQETAAVGFPFTSMVITGGLYHASPIGFLVAAILARGVDVIESQDDVERYVRTVERHRPVVARLTSVMQGAPFRRHDLSSVRLWMQGGYGLTDEQRQSFLRDLGPRIALGYGSTELHGIAVLLPRDYEARPDRLLTVGRPFPGVEVRIDPRAGEQPADGAGRVLIRSASRMLGYHGHPPADEWFDTGDIGLQDEDGCLRLLGRMPRDAFERATGAQIWPAQLEYFINHHPSVRDCVVSRRDGEWWAIAELRPGVDLTAGELHRFLQMEFANKLPASQFPSRYVLRRDLPRDERGKIRVDVLAREGPDDG